MNEALKKVKVPAEDMERILNKMDHWRRMGVPEAEVQQYFKDCVSSFYVEKNSGEEQMNKDKELLTLAAKAAGYTLEDHYDDDQYYPWCTETDAFFNPLLDDGDALRLMVSLRIDVAVYSRCVSCGDAPLEFYDNDPCSAVRRAIVRAAAEIGKEKEA